ncbi:hypothetical protein [Arthrobacter sp. KNU40]|uniref:hypothetical protein n=1 Tax=Arthrobacter sp. KNU40 TaxID=3447965 RepID=UPI003F5EBC32
MSDSLYTAWGAFLFMMIVATPFVILILTFVIVNRRRMRLQYGRDKASAKTAIMQGMYDQQVNREAIEELLAEGSVYMEEELRIQQIAKHLKRKQGGELDA